MPRKTELIAEETAVSSPLRRSSRKTVVANSPAPATITTRRNSQSQTETVETKAPKTRRASLSQENTEKAELSESKPAPRGRRASTAKEDTEPKTEPAKTRSRRSSAASEPSEETEKKQVVTRRRRSTTVEEELEPQGVKLVRGRRGSVTEKTIEEDTVKKPTKGGTSVKREETKEEPKKNLRRRSSVTEEIPETDTKEKKLTRGRRSSVDKLDSDNEPEAKTAKVTPIKLKRRQSITENAVNLEPIEEQDSEIKGRISVSPPNLNLKKAVVNLTTLKSNKETTNLDLSTIDESSFTEDSLNKSKSEKKVVTPRKSPRLNKESVPNSRDSLTPSKSKTHPKQMNETNENVEKNMEQNKANLNNENVDEVICAKSINNKTDEGLENSDSSTRKKLDFEPSSTVEINSVDIGEASEIDIKEETGDVQEKSLICDVSESHTESIDESVLELECEQEKLSNKQTVEDKNKREYPDISMGSDGSFRFNLNVSLPGTNLENTNQDDNIEDELNTSKNSNGSDKENFEVNSAEHPNVSKVNVGEKLKITNINAQEIYKEVNVQEVVVARVSNVFQPKMIENSFMEPMEVDEYPSILEATQNRKSLDLEESNVKDTPPAVSTPIVKRAIQKVDHMEAVETKNESDFKLSIEITENVIIEKSSDVDQIKDETEELEDKYEIIPEDITLGLECTKEESEVNPTSKEDISEDQILKTLPEDTTNIEEAIEDTKMSTNITVETENIDQSPTKVVETVVLMGNEEQDERSKNSLTEQEMEKRQSDNFANNEKLEETTPQIANVQETEQELHDIENDEESGNKEMILRIPNTPPAGSDVLDPEKKLRKPKSPQPEMILRIPNTPPAGSDELDPEKKLRKSESPQPEQIKSKEREILVKTIEVENGKDNSPKEIENLEIQTTDIDELESEIEKASGKPKYLLTKTLVVELESHPTSDGQTPKKDRGSLRKSNSPPSQESETPKNKQRRSLRNSRSPSFERPELAVDQNGKNNLPSKSSPQSQCINTDEAQILESIIPTKLKDTVELEPEQTERRNSPTNQDFLRDSSELKESGKLDISDDYEFDIPSDEEIDKLQEDAIKPIVSENADKSDISTKETVETVTQSSPLKRKSNVMSTEEVDAVLSSPLKKKSIHSEINESETMKITSICEEGLPDLDCRNTVGKVNSTEEQTKTANVIEGGDSNMSESNNKLVSVTEIENTKESIDQESNLNEEIADQNGVHGEKINVSIQDEVEDSSISTIENVNCNSTFKIGSPKIDTTEMKIDELVAQHDIAKDVKKKSPIKTLQINITNDLQLNARRVIIKNSEEKSISNYTINESATFNVEEMESDFKDVIQDSSDIKKGRMSKRKSKKRRDSTKQHIDIMGDEEEVQVDHTPKDTNIVGSIEPCEDGDNEESKVAKETNESKRIDRNIDLDDERKPKKSALSGRDFISSNPKNNSSNIVEDRKKMKKSKESKIVLGEDNTELNNKENSKETSVGEEFGSNPSKKGKKQKKQQKPENNDVVETVESNKKNEEVKQKPQKNTSLNASQGISSRKGALEGLEPFAMSKLDKYLSQKISEMESEDESYETSTTEEDDREENEFISTMAEEGEEDTPSEGSNDIIDEGESINSTESEVDTEDDYDENDSFICDDEAAELLSGDEYDLDDKKKEKKEKKSRIIKIDAFDDDIIKIKKKEKPVKKNKRSRIITLTDSSDSDLDKKDGHEESIEIEEDVDSLSKSLEVDSGVTKETSDVNEVTDDEVIILEEHSTPVKSPCNLIISGANLNISTAEAQTRKKKSSITIHENINVSEIKDTALSDRISNMVDSFCTTLYAGEISVNLSLEHAVVTNVTGESSQDDDVFIKETKKDKKGKRLSLKRRSRDSGDSEAFEEGEPSKKVHRLSVTLDNIESPNELNQEQRKRSKSLENVSVSKSKKKKNKKGSDETKKATEKSLRSKKKMKSKKLGNSKSRGSTDELRTQTFSIMNQLITDVKNRPVRTIKPTVTMIDMNGSWVTEVADVRPSTTLVNKRELDDYKSGKIHPKDFRSKMLYDSSRVRRVDTKTLLRKKGAYF